MVAIEPPHNIINAMKTTKKINYREYANCKKASALKLCKQIAEALETGENMWNIDAMTDCLSYDVKQFKMYDQQATANKQ